LFFQLNNKTTHILKEITLIKTQKEELLLQNSELQDQIKKVQQQLQTLQKEMSSSSLKETIHKLNEQVFFYIHITTNTFNFYSTSQMSFQRFTCYVEIA
jgi:predicted nuclease with TOPRIM domain